MSEEAVEENPLKRYFRFDSKLLSYDSFLGLGFESVFVAVIGGVLFGFLIGFYPLIKAVISFLPDTNLMLFIAFGVPLTGSTHFDPRLGFLSSTIMLLTARSTQMLFGLIPLTQEALLLAGIWSVAQIFLIGYLPGRIISTSENIGYLFKGLLKISIIYALGEYIILTLAIGSGVPVSSMMVYPVYSLFLLTIVSSITTFIFTNTFCPYMMMPLISSAVKGQRQCGTRNFVYKFERPVEMDAGMIKEASKRGFRCVSQLPSVTVFTCPLGGMISIYHTGEVLIRKVREGQAERMFKNLNAIMMTN